LDELKNIFEFSFFSTISFVEVQFLFLGDIFFKNEGDRLFGFNCACGFD